MHTIEENGVANKAIVLGCLTL